MGPCGAGVSSLSQNHSVGLATNGKARGNGRVAVVGPVSPQSPASTPQPVELMGTSWNQGGMCWQGQGDTRQSSGLWEGYMSTELSSYHDGSPTQGPPHWGLVGS